MSKLIARLPLIAAFLVLFASFTAAQEVTPATPDAAKQQEEKAKLEAKAAALLEQIVSEAQGLKLPENRIRVADRCGRFALGPERGTRANIFHGCGFGTGEHDGPVRRFRKARTRHAQCAQA